METNTYQPSREKLNEYLIQVKDLNIIPPVLIQVMALPDDNELSFKELSRLVQTDQILVSRIIKIANSPFYNRGIEITSLQNAIARLGFRLIRSMIVVAMNDSIFAHGNYRKFREEVWQHSIATAIYGSKLTEQFLGKQEIDKGMIGGLLQDIGKVILNMIDRKKYVEVLREFLETKKDIRWIEIEKFGVDHTLMGYEASKFWKLPSFVVKTIEERHLPLEEKSTLGVILTAADILVRKAGFGLYTEIHEKEYKEIDLHLKGELSKIQLNEIQKYIKENELYKSILFT
ncbi:MAG: HDOD domain-containing protein [Leptospiraceae bacterium]|nr:HDOD domain-containing protein [Leptospiraceae bacterium]MDW7976710.1 HDOD domain-containing protein [Leptospiraceae bacterium]